MNSLNHEPTPSPQDRMLVFDIDGVLTDPHNGSLDERAYQVIVSDLRAGIPVGLNTGRDMAWAHETIVSRLAKDLDPDSLNNFVLVAEKGGATIEFEDGAVHEIMDETLALPKRFMHEAAALLDEPYLGKTYGDYMELENKETMVTLGKRTDAAAVRAAKSFSNHPFINAQQQIAEKSKALLQDYDERHGTTLATDYVIDCTQTAVDIQHVSTGKDTGAQHILAWMERRGFSIPKKVVSFGDSSSDRAMAEEFAKHTESVFVYVGPEKDLMRTKAAAFSGRVALGAVVEQGPVHTTVVTEQTNAAGTIEYLRGTEQSDDESDDNLTA